MTSESEGMFIAIEKYDAVVAEAERLREALQKIAALDLPYRDTANRARQLARDALSRVQA